MNAWEDDSPIVVTGFSRCGSTMTMRMLYEGGIKVYADNNASFETDKIKDLPARIDWIDETKGKAFKLLEPKHFTLPRDRRYRFIALTRDANEQTASHSYFLELLGVLPDGMSRTERRAHTKALRYDNANLSRWLEENYPESDVLPLTFEAILYDPMAAAVKIAVMVPQLRATFAAEAVIDRPHQVMRENLIVERASSTAADYNLPISVVWTRLKERAESSRA